MGMGAKITIKNLEVAQGGVKSLGKFEEKREEKKRKMMVVCSLALSRTVLAVVAAGRPVMTPSLVPVVSPLPASAPPVPAVPAVPPGRLPPVPAVAPPASP